MDIFTIPRPPYEFNARQLIVNTKLATKASDRGVLPAAVTNLVVNKVAYKTFFDICDDPITQSVGATANRDTYQTSIYSPALEKMYTKYLTNNDTISPEDKLAMGIHSSTHSTTVIPALSTSPLMRMYNSKEVLVMIAEFRNAENNKLAKPAGVGFVEIWYKIGGDRPTSLEDTNLKMNISKSGTPITFILSQKGLPIYFFARWVTTKGGYSPWTDLMEATIA